MKTDDIVIIGAGPAGISAAIQLKRYGLNPILLEKSDAGGLLINANLVENYPGFPDGITGAKLVALFKKQLENAQIKVDYEEVLRLDYKNTLFHTNTNRRKIVSRIIIIASGTKPIKLSVFDLSPDIAKYIFYDVYPFKRIKNQRIAIIGAGDAAFDYALNLSKKNDVLILNRTKKAKCLPILWQRAMENNNISYFENTIVKNIALQNDGLSILLRNDAAEWNISISYLLVAIGREPSLDFLSENICKSLKRLEKAKSIYLIGDVKNGDYRQTSIAVGDGIRAAMEIYKKLNPVK